MPSSTENARPASTSDGRQPDLSPAVRLSAVLPVLAEKDTVTEIVDGLHRGIGDRLHEVIILLAGRAPQETIDVCEAAERRWPRVRVSRQRENPGIGRAVRQGIAEATGTHILLMDSDGEMDVETVPRMLDALLAQDAVMVVGSRWMKGGGVEGYDPKKYWLNRAYQLLFRILFRTRVHDLTLGFKLGRADVMQALPWTSDFHDIGCETTLRVIRARHRVIEVPTVWRCRLEGTSSNPFRNNFKYVWMAFRILFGPSHSNLRREPAAATEDAS